MYMPCEGFVSKEHLGDLNIDVRRHIFAPQYQHSTAYKAPFCRNV